MAPITNERLLFNSVPTGYPEPGKTTVFDTTEKIDLQTVALNGGALIKTLALSIDPYLRSKMRDAPEDPSTFTIGKPITNFGVGVVIRSESSKFKAGDHVYGILPFQKYSVENNLEGFTVLENPHKLSWSSFLGVLGMPGQTAYVGWKEYSNAKKGDTVFVSSGAGGVGSLVIQLAKLDGLKVIASAGSEEKVKFMKEIGADVAFNYKTTSTSDILEKEGPIDVYFDNVGGETLDTAITKANVGARFIECGMISGQIADDYNTGFQPIKNLAEIVPKSISIYGLFFPRLMPKHGAQFYAEIPTKVASGEIKHREHVYDGLAKGGEALLAVQKGLNNGKAVIHVSDE